MSTENATQTATPTAQTGQKETPWVAIFRAGKYPQGEYTQQDLDEMITNYDPVHAHEAPISTDHEQEGPAQGWVSQLKREGTLLYAKFKQVSDEFRSQIREGRFKKPSAEIHPNYEGSGKKYLYAVTFLGARVPQIKGLPAAAFSDGNAVKETITIPFQEEDQMAKELAEQLAEKDAELAKFREEQKKKDETLQAKETELAQFREKQKKDGEALQAKDAELARVKKHTEMKEVSSFFEARIKEGKALPAWVDAGIVEFSMSLDTGANQELAKFAEAGNTGQTPTMSQRDWFKRFVAGLPAVINFKETITTGAAPQGQGNGDAGNRLHELTVRKMHECKDLNYRQAFSEVQKENPILAMKHMESAPEANNG